ncbi:hypothetical protein [Labrys wisconsinensis]|uniref:Nitrate reductase n=1 Tax=Labrys wisconsinensis TaxID=425677 RepID=A0ABU0JA42_9HYPH|nr:hypothetical protein [Labrys wisconsinensis]MDQ0471129.1 hypothetical protein [Labrys wisconsinensis]
MLGLFRRPSPEERRQAETVKALVRACLALDERTTISVSEIQCGDAACPGTETVILVMAPGQKTRAYKVASPLGAVDAVAVTAALAVPAP